MIIKIAPLFDYSIRQKSACSVLQEFCFAFMKHNVLTKVYIKVTLNEQVTQPAITCSRLTIETLEQGVKYVPS